MNFVFFGIVTLTSPVQLLKEVWETVSTFSCLYEADSKEDIFKNTCVHADNAAATVKDSLVSID